MEFDILYFINGMHFPLLDWIMVFITHLGSKGIFWIILSAVLMIFPETRKCGITVMAALLLSLLFGNILLKNIVQRMRPCWIDSGMRLLVSMPEDYSFPSGHTFASFAAAAGIFMYYRRAGMAAMALAALIGFSRLYLFVHFPSDVLAGAVLGVLSGILAYALTQKLYKNLR